MINNRELKIIGVVTILYWFSLCVYIPPIAPVPNFDHLLDELQTAQQALGDAFPEKLDQSRGVIRKQLIKETTLIYSLHAIPIVLGIIAGLLIFLKKKLGLIIALGLSLIFIFFNVKNIFSTYPYVFETFKLRLEYFPAKTLHEEVFGLAFYFLTLAILTRSNIANKFKNVT